MSQIEEMVTSTINSTKRTQSEATTERTVALEQTEKQTEQHGKAGTPTDVRDIHF